ncbi:MAG TPA: restriction endonuclease subunit S [Dissulfurispiraceae bacterium]|nr:restriction endonuclease subunit S [Dissulfurispiraceae bacterium]
MSEWVSQALGELVAFQKGRKVETSEHLKEGFAPYLGASAISGVIEEYADMRGGVTASIGDVLMLWDGERSGLVGKAQPGVISSTVARLSPKKEIDGEFLYYALDANFEWIQGRRTGTGVPHVPKDLSRILVIHYPEDKKEQRRIAEILSTLDKTIEQTEALITKHQQIKAGLMHDLFTRGVTPDGKLRPPREQAPDLYKESPLGWIPKEWEVEKLGILAEIVSGVTLGAKGEKNDEIGVPYLRVANVQDGYFDLMEVKTVRVSRVQFEKLQLQYGDVLMNEGGDFDKLGRGSVWQEEIKPCIHQNHVFRVRPKNDRLRSFYLAFWSQSEIGKKYFVLSSKQSTNLASINSTQLKRFPVALPSSNEQERIETRLFAMNEHHASLRRQLANFREQKQGLMHDLLTGRVRISKEVGLYEITFKRTS